MDELTISPEYVRRLIVKARAVMAREELVTPDLGGDVADDAYADSLHDTPSDLTREELAEELEGVEPDHQNELVALMWLGRGDGEPQDWADLMQMAADLRETPTPHYLLDHPLVADYWDEGLSRLGY